MVTYINYALLTFLVGTIAFLFTDSRDPLWFRLLALIVATFGVIAFIVLVGSYNVQLRQGA